MSAPTPAPAARRVNVRTPEVMERVQAEVETHYRSHIVEKIRAQDSVLTVGTTTVRLARDFGFCYGVERAIDLAYAARKVFADRKVFLLGEIIHNQEVNRQLTEMGVVSIPNSDHEAVVSTLTNEDVVIVPAFGAETRLMKLIAERGCLVVDTTCGDVMSVWKRVRQYAKTGFTSIIHGKASHEETRATSSRAMGDDGMGNYLVVLTLADVDYVCDYMRNGGDKEAFLRRFPPTARSVGFDPDLHLTRIGVANQTTMLKSETEEVQRRLKQAVLDRDGAETGGKNFQVFDTICGATQERQDSLFGLLQQPLDVLLVVGGYNSSNTTHLVEIGEQHLPTFFIRTAECLKSLEQIVHFDLHSKAEKESYSTKLAGDGPLMIGITAGASCPNNLIEDTVLRVFKLRGIDENAVRAALN
ncbi:MAG: 4-hydroxy-3-methylbut-2-enyl diphosphate reductase [Prosthecobacter sp.]|jgi:4-hydroxy-3-methylbut-2-enyl diphosphate reductase|uniref:4-hydroxy-3-methylbut-2-enyl diphosphate reductase n=1 Tax=Prosthecobacter sp. TaxID=1965333 RepID=UPI001A0C166A|nr:4-hydroxy-3-methylbut-2-enyl diphosphate reductase [Prosthecobacter sp.]MBE2286838.1 4-hydroxy-3-methylbut-2-enyl diphosphate reductase [Prosthecobacter sp.]